MVVNPGGNSLAPGTLATVATPGPTVLATHPTIETIKYSVLKIPRKSKDDRVVEVKRTFIKSTTS